MIGTGVLSSFVLEIDCANSRIRFGSCDAFDLRAPVALALRLMLRESVWPTSVECFWLLGAGTCAQLGQTSVTRGIQLLPASRAAVFSYTQTVCFAALGALLLGERPVAWSALGGALVLGRA